MCSTQQIRIEEVRGVPATCIASPDNVDLVSSVAAGIWTVTHFSFTQAEMSGITKLDLERQAIARILSLCPPGRAVQVQFSDEESYMKAKQVVEGTLAGEDGDKWALTSSVTAQRRHLEVTGFGSEVELGRIQEVVMKFANSSLAKALQALRAEHAKRLVACHDCFSWESY
jgi:hypothetical protein